MNIGAKERLATACVLVVIGALAVVIGTTDAQMEQARRESADAADIARALADIRLVTAEYIIRSHDRARAQWLQLSTRLDAKLANMSFADAFQQEILAAVRLRRAAARLLFEELSAPPAGGGLQDSDGRLLTPYRTQLFGRLLINQQDNLAAAFTLSDLAERRRDEAQDRLLMVIFAGLGLIALVKLGVSALIHYDVLRPVSRLGAAARQVAAGSRNFSFSRKGTDEIAQLGGDIGSMTASLGSTLGRMEAANRELEAFAYLVAHDLRAPLRAIDGFSQVLLEDCAASLDDEGKDALRRIRAASQRMGQLIDDMLTLSLASRGEVRLETVNLSRLAAAACDAQRAAAPQRTVCVSIAPGVTARGDARLLSSVLSNLMSNAWKFTAHRHEAHIEFGARVQQEDGELVCHVRDDGAGFDMAYADNLFEPFQRIHSTGEFPGNGIGLAVVKRLISRLGGRVWAEGAVNRGATFYFTLPLLPAQGEKHE